MELNTIINIINKYNLSADELLLIYLTFISQSENGNIKNNKIYFEQWYDGTGKNKLLQLFNSLKEKGIIKKNYNPEEYDPDEIEFNKTFIKQYFKYTGELGKELYDNYPSFITINNKVYSLKNISKKFISLDEFYFYYSSTIGHNLNKHNEIIDLLKWGKENDQIRYGILEFVASNKWNELLELKNDNKINNIASSESIFINE